MTAAPQLMRYAEDQLRRLKSVAAWQQLVKRINSGACAALGGERHSSMEAETEIFRYSVFLAEHLRRRRPFNFLQLDRVMVMFLKEDQGDDKLTSPLQTVLLANMIEELQQRMPSQPSLQKAKWLKEVYEAFEALVSNSITGDSSTVDP
ncbi:hypothetical protein AK812_SmicGene3328 [Symbiodinium microadriaticum]|uniref:Uncharacterized protein n=1 Tax=Symbiodinium microadriaticum TaxID=2951 RepID=A0A1Q9EZC6_SYMMI|nr:hypothetical protein AK812_SmicGene3328 [Symbiodinium microadriaticum]